ncbi:P1 family peptidase [Nocardioides caldifontis]|uniref:P1 family peptidase n=1 Tax=Nocardioides caldifontis TaxID=2588938 RepID=UPI0011DF982E|nr:P1 family peptidase [Nocardioides caldifontis]
MTGDLTDVPGIRVGHWSDRTGLTGCTVVLLPDEGTAAGVAVRGAAPGTRETDLLDPGAMVPGVHAVLLTGGSAFGLAAADGVLRRLEERGVGLETGAGPVPIVPAAVLYDLTVGSAEARPDAAAGYAACRAAEEQRPCGSGQVGAGTGARVGKLFDPQDPAPGGLGTASLPLPGGGTVGAVVAVNALGDVVDEDGRVLSGHGTAARLLAEGMPELPPVGGANTTLALVATDLALTKAQAGRLASVAHDGFARAIRPVHTSYDGDTVFAVSTGQVETAPEQLLVLETAAAEVVARAVRAAVTG